MPRGIFEIHVEIDGTDPCTVADFVRVVANRIERAPHWGTTSGPITDDEGRPFGHWRILEHEADADARAEHRQDGMTEAEADDYDRALGEGRH